MVPSGSMSTRSPSNRVGKPAVMTAAAQRPLSGEVGAQRRQVGDVGLVRIGAGGVEFVGAGDEQDGDQPGLVELVADPQVEQRGVVGVPQVLGGGAHRAAELGERGGQVGDVADALWR